MRKFIFSIALLAIPFAVCSRTVVTCVSYDEQSKIDRLRKELEAEGVKYHMESFPDNKGVCVSSEDRSKLIAIELKLFPPSKAPPRSVKIPPSPSGIPLTSVKLVAPEHQQALEAELIKQGIWFTKDEGGAIWYEVTREKEVQEIQFHVIETVATPSQDEIPVGRNIGYGEKAQADVLTNLLAERGIKSVSKRKNNTYWVIWDAKDNNRMEPLIAEAQRRIAVSERK
jgi:hypothetical protein